MIILYDNYVLEAIKKTKQRNLIALQKKNSEDSNGGQNRCSQSLSGNPSQNKSSKPTIGLIKKFATNKPTSQTSKTIKAESKPTIVEIESKSEPKSPIKDGSKELEPKLKQESVKNDPSSNPKEEPTSGNLQNSDLKVVKHKIYDVVSYLGKDTLPIQQTVIELMNLAMAIENNKLSTSETFTPEGSGHNKKYVVTTIYDVLSALGSGSATQTETIGKLFNLSTWLSNPPPKATATETKAPKDKDLDPAKASGPKPTDADKTNIKTDAIENDGATPKSGKGKGKKKQTAEDDEVKVPPENPDKEAPPASGGDEKKDGKERVTPANSGKEDIKPALPGKMGAAATGVAGEEGAVPIASGDADTAPKTEAPKPLSLVEVVAQQALQSSETRPEVMNQRLTQSEAQPPTNQTPREVECLNFVQSQTQFQGQPTPRIVDTVNNHNSEFPNLSQPQTQFSGQPMAQIRETGNHHVSQPQTQFSGQPGQPALQIGEMGNLPGFAYRNIPQTQTQFSGQPTPQIVDTVNNHNFRFFSQPQTQFSGQPTSQIRETGNHYISQPQTQFPGQPALQISEMGNFPGFQRQNQFSGQPTPQIGEPGNQREFGYGILPQQQTQFLRQQFPQATEAYIPGEFGNYTGAQLQILNPLQRTQQAGEFGSVDGYSRYHPTKSQDRPTFQIQQSPPGYVNGTSHMYIREIKPNQSVPLTDTCGGSTGPTSYQFQGPADGRNPYADSARQVHLSPHKPAGPKPNLPGSYDQDDLSDSSGSFSSSESEFGYIRDRDRRPNDQDGPNNRGRRDTRHSRHGRHDRHKSDEVSSHREESGREATRRGRPRRDGSHSGERHAEETHHHKEYRSRRDKTRTKPAYPENLQTTRTTTTSKNQPIVSDKQPSWGGYYFPFVRS